MKKYCTVGLLAHVDAGKTTLAERMLYQSGVIRQPGRVDHKDAFLDTHALEKDRGITIFSQQAVLPLGEYTVTLLDTPGHVDFSAETERTLQVLDLAVLIISGADGVQGHTRTLWNLLKQYEIPTFVFFNKMDQPGTDKAALLAGIRKQLDEACVDFNGDAAAVAEAAALYQEEALEEYLAEGSLTDLRLMEMIGKRQIFPCYFGSALKGQGVPELMEGIRRYAPLPEEDPKAPFGARVFKISRDEKGTRLTHMKLTGGTLKVRDPVPDGEGEPEKVNQIRLYSGEKYTPLTEAYAGQVVAVTGPAKTRAGQTLGAERQEEQPASGPVLTPVQSYRLILPEGTDMPRMMENLRQLEEEDPTLTVLWDEELKEIHVRLMGEIQTQVLKSLIQERFGVEVDFGPGSIIYQETIENTVEGIGHFEPLKHYAEVHLRLEPGEPGSGLTFASDCREDMLDQNWQRQVLTSLKEKVHRGVLTGAPLTDVKITLTAGRAHEKHTSGGDFRQAAYRAVRQGLMQAKSVLLEPWYTFRLELPADLAGRAMTDLTRMSAACDPPQTLGDVTVLTGTAPVSELQGYPQEVAAYSRGQGKLSLTVSGYRPCHNAEEVIAQSGYDPEADADNPCGSVFCAHGAGFSVPWNEVEDYMHLERQTDAALEDESGAAPDKPHPAPAGRQWDPDEEAELEEIFLRTYGKIKHRHNGGPRTVAGTGDAGRKKEEKLREYLLVDGYNVIHAWDELWDLARDSLDAARMKLMDILCNYQGFTGDTVILVFDAYKLKGNTMEIQKYHNIYVVYTKEAETADMYIEKVVHEIGHKYHVTVVTSDGVEQVVTLGSGGTLKSSREFEKEVDVIRKEIREEMDKQREKDAREGKDRNYLFDHMEDDLVREMEEIRLGKRKE